MVFYITFIFDRFDAVRIIGIYPKFIKMDKDIGQINAAKEIWPRSTISLCLWHILRAIKKRLLRPTSGKQLNLER